MDSLTRDWDITDEGPMEDLLGIEVDYLPDGAIKLHQTSYVKKLMKSASQFHAFRKTIMNEPR